MSNISCVSCGFNIAYNLLRKSFVESMNRKLVGLPLDPDNYIRVYAVGAPGSNTVLTTEKPVLVTSYANPIYFVDVPMNYKQLAIPSLVESCKISYVYDVKNFITTDGTPKGYNQDAEYNERSSFLIGIICGLLLQGEYLNG